MNIKHWIPTQYKYAMPSDAVGQFCLFTLENLRNTQQTEFEQNTLYTVCVCISLLFTLSLVNNDVRKPFLSSLC